MRYTLRQLEIFLAAAHYQNISQAAESLSMSQSAASEALKELEFRFDIRLFDRIGKRLQLNDFGRALQPRAEELLARAQELEAAFGRHIDSGPLKVGATLSIGNYMTIPMITEYMDLHPGGRVSLEVANTARIVEKLSQFELDVGLIEGEVHNADLHIVPWMDDELVVFCARDYPLAGQGTLSDDEILTHPWILREAGSGTRQTFDRAMHDLLPQLNILLELQHTEAIKRAVSSGLGLGCLSRITLGEVLKRGEVVELAVSRDLKRQLYLVLHRKKYISVSVENWLKLCGPAGTRLLEKENLPSNNGSVAPQ